MQCPMCKAELSSKRVAVPDKQFEGLLAALYAHEEDGTHPTHAGGAEEEDDMDELMALCVQARQLKQVEESHALEVCERHYASHVARRTARALPPSACPPPICRRHRPQRQQP